MNAAWLYRHQFIWMKRRRYAREGKWDGLASLPAPGRFERLLLKRGK